MSLIKKIKCSKCGVIKKIFTPYEVINDICDKCSGKEKDLKMRKKNFKILGFKQSLTYLLEVLCYAYYTLNCKVHVDWHFSAY